MRGEIESTQSTPSLAADIDNELKFTEKQWRVKNWKKFIYDKIPAGSFEAVKLNDYFKLIEEKYDALYPYPKFAEVIKEKDKELEMFKID